MIHELKVVRHKVLKKYASWKHPPLVVEINHSGKIIVGFRSVLPSAVPKILRLIIRPLHAVQKLLCALHDRVKMAALADAAVPTGEQRWCRRWRRSSWRCRIS